MFVYELSDCDFESRSHAVSFTSSIMKKIVICPSQSRPIVLSQSRLIVNLDLSIVLLLDEHLVLVFHLNLLQLTYDFHVIRRIY